MESLLTLEYPKDRLEIIFVDGLSTDKTLEIVKDFVGHSKLKCTILSDSGLGLGYARRIIVEKASAEFIAFIDADQYLHRQWLKEALKDMLATKEIAAVRGVVGLTPCSTTPARLEAYRAFAHNANVPPNLSAWYFAIGGSLLRKSAIVGAGNFDPKNTSVGEDTDIAFKMVKQGWELKNSRGAIFYHQPRPTWKGLFRQSCSYAISTSIIGKKYARFRTKKRLLLDFLLSSILETRYIFNIFRRTHDLRCVLLPVEHIYTIFGYYFTFWLR